VRRGPRHLLHADADAGIASLELRDELVEHLALGTHRPELELHAPIGRVVAARGEGEGCA